MRSANIGSGTTISPAYDVIVCGSGSAGLVVAARLAEDPDTRVLLLEAGGTDAVEEVEQASEWRANLGSERDWGLVTEPNPGLHGRTIRLSTGRVLGGGSSINAMGWARGHRADWDHFAEVSRESEWRYESVKQVFERIEMRPDGGGGFLETTAARPGDTTEAVFKAIRGLGLPTFERPNGEVWESDRGGGRLLSSRFKDGVRLSLVDDYFDRLRGRDNLTVIQRATVLKVGFEGRRARDVVVRIDGSSRRIRASREIILSLGALNTPRVLVHSGIGDGDGLRALGIGVVQHLPGVGKGLQDHMLLGGFLWERRDRRAEGPDRAILDVFARSDDAMPSPDIKCTQLDGPLVMPGQLAGDPPKNVMSLMPGIVRPRSSGTVRIVNADPEVSPVIDAGYLSHPADMRAFLAAVELARDVASSTDLRGFLKGEVLTAGLRGGDLESFVRQYASTYWHPSCSARMGHDGSSVVDGRLRVHGVDGLRIADASIMPRITTGLTMAPCVIIGERAAQFIRGGSA